MAKINKKFEYCGYTEESSDRDFLGFIYARLNMVFGESPSLPFMERLEKYIDKMSGKIRIGCDCTVADKCPQGKKGVETRCSIWKENNQ